MAVESDIELYDTDVVAIGRVVAALGAAVGQRRNGETFKREVAERFAEIGFLVDVDLGSVAAGGDVLYLPTITVCGRVEAVEEFDYAQMTYEVRSNVLGDVEQPGMTVPVQVSVPR